MKLFLFIFIFSLINFLYIKIWNKFSNKVPTGIGILLTIPFFFYLEKNFNFFSVCFILVFTIVYFLDDLIEINFLWRILLQILVSFVIYFSFNTDIILINIFVNLVIFLILVNTLNFQDGEDLNIALLLILIFGNFYFNSEYELTKYTSEFVLIFLISFSFFNFKKKFLYFGDSSCYFISIIIFLFAHSELQNAVLIKTLIAIITYPIVDVFYVIAYRIFKKENLLTRNYLHFYQIIARKKNLKLYLLPNILFASFNIFISQYFSLGIHFIIFLVITNTVILIVAHQSIQKLAN